MILCCMLYCKNDTRARQAECALSNIYYWRFCIQVVEEKGYISSTACWTVFGIVCTFVEQNVYGI